MFIVHINNNGQVYKKEYVSLAWAKKFALKFVKSGIPCTVYTSGGRVMYKTVDGKLV